MIKYIKEYISVCLLIIATSCSLFGQGNIIPNYSFEQMSSNQFCDTRCPPGGIFVANESEEYWSKMDNWGIPKQKYWCLGGAVGTPDNFCSEQNGLEARSGTNFVFAGSSEYLINKFSKKLNPNCTYFYEFYYAAKAGFEKSDIGIKFLSEYPYQCDASEINGEDANSCDISGGKGTINSQENIKWIRASGYFTPSKSYSHFALGSWNKSEGTAAFFDDVRIVPMCDNYCPEKWLIDNTIFENSDAFQASNEIKIGFGANPDVIDGEVILKSGNTLTLRSNTVTKLTPGFTAEAGSNLIIQENVNCELLPCKNPSFFDQSDFFACHGSNVELDLIIDPVSSWQITWSPAQYLSDVNSASPTFFPPAGKGDIDYTVAIKDLCGRITYKTVNVGYDDSPNPSPTHTAIATLGDYDVSFKGNVSHGMKSMEVEYVGTGYTRVYQNHEIQGDQNYNFVLKPEKIPGFTICDEYDVILRTRNYCSANIFETPYNWNPHSSSIKSNFIPNIITHNHDNINEDFTVDFSGITHYRIKVYDRWGILLKGKDGRDGNSWTPYSIKNQAIWTPKDSYPSGTVYYSLEVKSDCNNSIKRYNGNFYNYVVVGSNKKEEEVLLPASKEEIERFEAIHGPMGVHDIKESEFLEVYPNPATTSIKIHTEELEGSTYSIYSVLGSEVIRGNINQKIEEVNIDNLPKGVYKLVLYSKTSKTFKTFVKK